MGRDCRSLFLEGKKTKMHNANKWGWLGIKLSKTAKKKSQKKRIINVKYTVLRSYLLCGLNFALQDVTCYRFTKRLTLRNRSQSTNSLFETQEIPLLYKGIFRCSTCTIAFRLNAYNSKLFHFSLIRWKIFFFDISYA